MNDAHIYPYSLEYAQSRGELAAYWESAELNQNCAAAIDNAVFASNYDQYCYHFSDALTAVTKDFGLDRVSWVVASVIHGHKSDGRYSRANKEWACSCTLPHDATQSIIFQSHPTVLDGFADKVREVRLYELAQTVGAYEQNHHMAEHNRLTWFHRDMGSFIPKSGVTERQLAERSTEISEKQSVLKQLRAEKKAAKSAPTKKQHEYER